MGGSVVIVVLVLVMLLLLEVAREPSEEVSRFVNQHPEDERVGQFQDKYFLHDEIREIYWNCYVIY